MINKLPKHYLSSRLNEWQLIEFFDKLFPCFEKELKDAGNTFYHYETPSESINHLFSIIERTWLGLLNNAMVRNFPGMITLQEFMVWGSDNKAKGRCDLLFKWKEWDILVEAKCYEFKNDWFKDGDKDFYSKKFRKLRTVYYEEEKSYYSQNVLGMILVFEWIRDKKRLEQAIKILDNWDYSIDKETDFISIFQTESRGVILYGGLEVFNKVD